MVLFWEFARDFALGGVAGFVSKTITAPFSRVSFIVKMQEAIPDADTVDAGYVDCFRQIYREQGVFGFWRGNLVNAFRYFPVQAGNLAFKDAIMHTFPKIDLKDPEQTIAKMLFNALARNLAVKAMNVAIDYPFESVYISLLSGLKAAPGSTSYFSWVGFTSLYAGCGARLLEHFAHGQLYNQFFFPLNMFFGKRYGVWGSLVVGQIASSLSLFAVYGFRTVRWRLQLQRGLPVHKRPYQSSLDCARKIYTEEGISGFYKGFTLTLVEDWVAGFMTGFFKAAWSGGTKRRRKPLTSEQLTTAFQKYDLNQDGFITLDELRTAFKDKNWTNEHSQHVFNQFDRNGDGKISLQEFLLTMEHH